MQHFSISKYGLKIRFKLFGILFIIYVCKCKKREKSKEVVNMRTTEIKQHEEKKKDMVIKVTEMSLIPSDETFDEKQEESDNGIKEDESPDKEC